MMKFAIPLFFMVIVSMPSFEPVASQPQIDCENEEKRMVCENGLLPLPEDKLTSLSPLPIPTDPPPQPKPLPESESDLNKEKMR